jgi:hypothetical protein
MKMKKWQIILAATLALLVMVITPIAVLAAENNQPATTAVSPKWEGGLAIVAPRLAIVGQPMTMGVFLRSNQAPIAGVNVWAVTKESVTTLKSQFAPLRQNAANLADSDYEAILTPLGFKIGQTDGNGKLSYTFTAAGNFLLVAFKAHYVPDFSAMVVRNLPQVLGINTPRTSAPGESITISVFQKGTQIPVAEAGVWAVGKDKIADLQADVADIKAAGKAQTTDWDSVISLYGAKLGETDASGQLTATFDNAGGYLLFAVKSGYIPGYTGIRIVAPQPVKTPTTTTDERHKA